MESLFTSLESWWTLEETSGTRVDSHGSNDLTDNNTVLSAAGVKGTCADLENSNSESLSRSDNASLSVGDIDFTWAGWFQMESSSAGRCAFSKGSPIGTPYEYNLFYVAGGTKRFIFQVQNTTGGNGTVTANNLGAPSNGTWYYIICWHDSVNNEVGIQVNDTAANTASYSGGSHNGTGTMYIGRNANPDYWDGLADEVAFWKKILTTEEKAWLYNNGDGRTYSEIGAATGAGGAIYYNHNRKRK